MCSSFMLTLHAQKVVFYGNHNFIEIASLVSKNRNILFHFCSVRIKMTETVRNIKLELDNC